LNSSKLSYQTFKRADLDVLVTKSKAGDEAAFGKLAGIVHQLAFGYFESKFRLGKIRNIDDAEDLAQNVYIAFQNQFNEIDNLENWLRRVLFLNFINYYKKCKAHKFFDVDEVLRKKKIAEDHGSLYDVEMIMTVLKTLSEEKQIVLKMRIYDDLSFPDIAGEINKSVDAVKKIYYRTIEEIQKLMKE
jgi:RNA polymerase sigma factor (sigma-70 family)